MRVSHPLLAQSGQRFTFQGQGKQSPTTATNEHLAFWLEPSYQHTLLKPQYGLLEDAFTKFLKAPQTPQAEASAKFWLLELLKAVPEQGKAISKEASRLLWNAARNNRLTEAGRLLQIPGIDVNAQGLAQRTALIWAASRGHMAMVQLLLQAPNTNIHIQDERGDTALSVAQKLRLTEIQQQLQERMTQFQIKKTDGLLTKFE